MKITARNRAFGLIGILVTMVIISVLVGMGITARRMINRARTIAERREHQITNALADDALKKAPEFWFTTELEIPDEDVPAVLATIHTWRIEAAPTLQGPWTFTGNEFISDERFLRDIMLTIAAADSRSEEPRWFYRGVRP